MIYIFIVHEKQNTLWFKNAYAELIDFWDHRNQEGIQWLIH